VIPRRGGRGGVRRIAYVWAATSHVSVSVSAHDYDHAHAYDYVDDHVYVEASP
jgi:hypothetical protein